MLSRKIKLLFSFQLFILLSISTSVFLFTYLRREVRKNRKKTRQVQTYLDTHVSGGLFIKPIISSTPIPFSLYNTPLAESNGVVLDVKTVSIRNVPAPYNASIIDHGSKLGLFFRYDESCYGCDFPFETHIGYAELDEDFCQTEKEFQKIRLSNHFNEDPRVIHFNDELYLTYNSLKDPSKTNSNRIMKISRLDPNTLQVEEEKELDIQRQPIEKNWAPFVFTQNGKSELFFEYYLTPRQILKLENFSQGFLSKLIFCDKQSISNLGWPTLWGVPRGGTPACKIGKEYLAFFHSSFQCINNTYWYVMGAYTFEATPPFRITAISHYPIFFKGIFESTISNTANPLVRCVFPCGFIIRKKHGKELIHLSIGENDSCIKIVTLDKELLLKNLKKLHF